MCVCQSMYKDLGSIDPSTPLLSHLLLQLLGVRLEQPPVREQRLPLRLQALHLHTQLLPFARRIVPALDRGRGGRLLLLLGCLGWARRVRLEELQLQGQGLDLLSNTDCGTNQIRAQAGSLIDRRICMCTDLGLERGDCGLFGLALRLERRLGLLGLLQVGLHQPEGLFVC